MTDNKCPVCPKKIVIKEVKKKRLTDQMKISLACHLNHNGERVWRKEGLDRFTEKQLKYIFKKSQKHGIPILIDNDIFFQMWKRIQNLEKKVGL